MAGAAGPLHRNRRGRDCPSFAALFAALGGLSVLAAPRLARGQEPTRPLVEALHLGPGRCLDARKIAGHAGLWLQRREVDRRLAVDVAEVAEGVRFVVRRDGAVLGERTLEIKKVPCEEIQAALGLGIASAIDATVLLGLGVPAPVPPAPSPSSPPSPPPPSPSPTSAPLTPLPGASPSPVATAPGASSASPRDTGAPSPPRRRPTVTATVQAVALVDVLPKVVLGASPSVELTVVPAFDLRVAALATGTANVTIGVGTADVGLVGGLVEGCGAVGLGSAVRLRGCAGVAAGVVNAVGNGFPDSKSATAPWVAPSVRADVRWAITRLFGVVAGVDGFFPGLKPQLQVVDQTGGTISARTFPIAGAGVSLGPSLTF